MPSRFLAPVGVLGALAAPAMAGPQVATDIAPLHSLVARVMAGAGEPALIVPPGASPHGHALRPSEAAALDRAEIVFWMGEGLTPWLEDAIGTLAGDAHVIELLGADGSTVLAFREGLEFTPSEAGHGHDMPGHAAHTAKDEDGHEAHDHEGADPHAWLDPANARAWLALIAGELARHDPDNAALYAANAAEAVAELSALEAGISARLDAVRDVPYLVFHDAYQYFESRFGVAPAGALALSDAADPGPARIAALRDLARDRGVACVFTEPQFAGARVRAVFGDTVRHGVLDPLGSAYTPGAGLYPALLEDMAAALVDCLGGS
ncbi:zinc ABC transporter substrate-binding protein [Roseovarius autotrophicus]|uniref:zinc ABC transporter substrate-binding protein n=1 Tax=Roseovarius autotrophicus TaxID=2824121 RepID=UPI0019E60D1B|nr:zinc ABC transporter substrate-binding protein [Roseovarius autotrophicus]MBE0453908.1 zinc ABC transporter substrate-binding protein [Roseovarius sp.]